MKRFFTFTLGYVALALGGLSVVGFAGTFFWMFDLSNSFRVQYLVASMIGLGLSLVLHSRILLGCFVAILGCNLFFICPLYFKPSGHVEKGGGARELSVMSYNVWMRNDDWESIKSALEAEDSTIIYLTELHPDIQGRIKTLKNEFHVFQNGSNAILVRRDAKLNPRLAGSFQIDEAFGLLIMLEFEGTELWFMGIHPLAPLNRLAGRRRDEAFDGIASFVENSDEMVIVAGDFNATPWSSPFRSLQERTGLVNSQRGFGVQTTWPSYPDSYVNWVLRAPIDHCLHSPEIVTLDRKVGDAGKSNHNPIRVRLRVPVSQ